MSGIRPRIRNAPVTTSLAPTELLSTCLTLFTRAELGRRVGVGERTVRRWERGETGIPEHRVDALRRLLTDHTAPAASEESPFTFIDLFAGIGGLRTGFERAGGHCVLSSEWDRFALQTYRANFGNEDEHFVGDIRDITASSQRASVNSRMIQDRIPDHDVLLAGFPCQPFSLAGVSKKNSLGRQHGFMCEAQGTLFFDVARILEVKRPRVFLLENVKNLRSHDRGRTYEVIRKVLEEDLGYTTVTDRVIDARGFVPQHRERIFILGFRDGADFSWGQLDMPDRDSRTLGDILHPEDGSEDAEPPYTEGSFARVAKKYTLSAQLWRYLQDYREKHRAAGNGFGFSKVGRDDTARTLSARYHKDGSEILIERGPRARPRRLTPRECARLMGFPDHFTIPVSDTQAYRQFGNSVCVPLVSEIAKAMVPFVIESKARESRSPQFALPLRSRRASA